MASRWAEHSSALTDTEGRRKVTEVEAGIALFHVSLDTSLPLGIRYRALQDSHRKLEAVCLESTPHLRQFRLLSLDRVSKALFCRCV